MNCKFVDVGPYERLPGFRFYHCTRQGCGLTAYSPYTPDRIISKCRGWPLPNEHREWIALFAAAVGVSGAIHYAHYIRWRAKGSPIDQLPPGIPHPNIVPPPAPADGPGTELATIFRAAGASSDLCSGACQEWVDKMNRWGIDGCRAKANRALIIQRIKTAMFKTWVTDQIKIGWSISREPWFRSEDPVGCIVDEAIRRALDRLRD